LSAEAARQLQLLLQRLRLWLRLRRLQLPPEQTGHLAP
jgi:hypothetical protein